jgi:hypothetical protein
LLLLTDAFLETVGRRCKALRQLSLAKLAITDEGLARLTTACTELQ